MFSRRSRVFYGGHRDEIHCLVLSVDLEILLTGSVRGSIRLWNTVLEHLTLRVDENRGRIRALAISNNDRYFASTANDTHVRLYRTRTGQRWLTLSGQTHVSDCLEFSSNSQWIASGAWDHHIRLWHVTTGEMVYDFHHHTNAVQSIAFHPTRNLFATGSHDQTICLYDLDQTSPVKPNSLRGHFNNIRALAFSHSSYLASAGWDKSIIIWHIDTHRIRNRLLAHSGWIQALSFRDAETSILASVDDETAYLWNIFSGLCLQRFSIRHDLACSVRFIPNSNGLVIGGSVYELAETASSLSSTQRLYELPTRERDRTIKLPILPCRLTRKN